jgi:hypothetical protein
MKLSSNVRDEIRAIYEIDRDSIKMCDEDLRSLLDWKWDEAFESRVGMLNRRGWHSLFDLANRLKTAYSELNQTYSTENYHFRHTKSARTRDSCYAFIDGLFGVGTHRTTHIESPSEEKDFIKV